MTLLSQLLHFDLVDVQQRHGRLLDLVVDCTASDYPPVIGLIVAPAGTRVPHLLKWDDNAGVSWERRRFEVDDLADAEPVPPERLARAVWLKRDVRDAMILDLGGGRVQLANDLWLEADGQRLVLQAADTSPWAVIRRLTPWNFALVSGERMIDWCNVEFLRGNPATARASGDDHRRLAARTPGEIARLIDALPYLHAVELLTLLPHSVGADVLELMMPERQLQVFEELDDEQALRLLKLMAPDIGADLLARLRHGRATQLLEALGDRQRAALIELLRYPDGTAGAIMTNDFVMVPATITAGEARMSVRSNIKEPDFVYYIYVVDALDTRRLEGVVSIRQLLLADDDKLLSTCIGTQLVTVEPLQSSRSAAQRVADTSLAALPVVGRNGQLVGIITSDTAVALLAPAAWREQAPRVFS